MINIKTEETTEETYTKIKKRKQQIGKRKTNRKHSGKRCTKHRKNKRK